MPSRIIVPSTMTPTRNLTTAFIHGCCIALRISISRSPASPSTNWVTRGSAAGSISLGRAVKDDLRLVRLQPRERIEHDDPVRHFAGRVHVVRDHDAGHRIARSGAQDQLVDHVAHDRVEAGGGLVVEHHFGIHGQGPGQADAFAHAAGQFRRLLLDDAFRQPDLGQPARARSRRFPAGWLCHARAAERPRSGRSSCCRTAPRPGTRSRTASARWSALCR